MWNWAYLLPMLGMSIPMVAIWVKHRQKIEEIRAEAASRGDEVQSAHIQSLEDRVRVLERIVTEGGSDAAQIGAQIDALREEQIPPQHAYQGDSGVPLNTKQPEKA